MNDNKYFIRINCNSLIYFIFHKVYVLVVYSKFNNEYLTYNVRIEKMLTAGHRRAHRSAKARHFLLLRFSTVYGQLYSGAEENIGT